MGEGAAANDVGVLYCCAPPNVHMNGVTVRMCARRPSNSREQNASGTHCCDTQYPEYPEYPVHPKYRRCLVDH